MSRDSGPAPKPVGLGQGPVGGVARAPPGPPGPAPTRLRVGATRESTSLRACSTRASSSLRACSSRRSRSFSRSSVCFRPRVTRFDELVGVVAGHPAALDRSSTTSCRRSRGKRHAPIERLAERLDALVASPGRGAALRRCLRASPGAGALRAALLRRGLLGSALRLRHSAVSFSVGTCPQARTIPPGRSRRFLRERGTRPRPGRDRRGGAASPPSGSSRSSGGHAWSGRTISRPRARRWSIAAGVGGRRRPVQVARARRRRRCCAGRG